MERREFLGAGALAGAALLGGCSQSQETASASAEAPSGKPVKMHAGAQHWAPTPENLQFIKRLLSAFGPAHERRLEGPRL